MPIPPVVKQLAQRTRLLFIIFLAAWLVPQFVEFPRRYEARLDRALEAVAVIALFLQVGIWVNVLVNYWSRSYIHRHGHDRGDATTIQAISVLIKVTLWIILAVITLEEGFRQNVTALVAGLGVGGIAIAFALQNVLADVFAAMSIVTDKPFVIGDSILVDTYSGKVEHIGLKSTRVRSDTGEQIVFGNSDLLKGRIRNFGRMEERQATVLTRVAGNTPPDKLALVPKIVREVIEGVPNTRFVRAAMTAMGDSTIDFTTVYYLTDPAYQVYVDSQQAVMLELIRRLSDEGILLNVRLEATAKEKGAGLNVSGAPA
ncbi:MAG TPA: mechanosensitive ion channel family protein [Gemmatimonadaceae bacterium]|jgi:small-conductance mechanosensitive channel|nr:mechanosensitive ion channel family protein [Gemmatimonadaceae bacterium]